LAKEIEVSNTLNISNRTIFNFEIGAFFGSCDFAKPEDFVALWEAFN
jgi:hypothetical protein